MANFMELDQEKLYRITGVKPRRPVSTASTQPAQTVDQPPDVIDCVVKLMEIELDRSIRSKSRIGNQRQQTFINTLKKEQLQIAKEEYIQVNMPKYLKR